MVQRGDERHHLLEPHAPVTEALVVVDEVKIAHPRSERLHGPQRERKRLAEGARGELCYLDEISDGLELPVGGEATGVEVVEQVEAAQFVQRHAVVEDRVGLPAVHLHLVAEVRKGLREVPCVDALTANVGLAPIGEIGDPEGFVTTQRARERGRSHGFPSLPGTYRPVTRP